LSRIRKSVVLLIIVLAPTGVISTAGGRVGCDQPHFPNSILNIILGEYEPAAPPPDKHGGIQSEHGSIQRDTNHILSVHPARLSADQGWSGATKPARTPPFIRHSAQRLAWLAEFDILLRSLHDGISVIAAFSDGSPGACRSDELLEALKGSSRPPPSVLTMTGRIYQEADDLLFQTKVRSAQYRDGTFRDSDKVTTYIKHQNGREFVFSAPVFEGEIVFPARFLTYRDLAQIERHYDQAARVYARKGGRRSRTIRLDSDEGFAYRIRRIDPDGWIEIVHRDGGQTVWMKTNIEVGNNLHRTFPELDFLQGLSAYMIVRSGAGATSIGHAAAVAFKAYLASAVNDPTATRSLALQIAGGAIVFSERGAKEGWRKAQKHFRRAMEVDNSNPDAINLLSVSELALCCSGDNGPSEESAVNIIGQLQDVIALRPNDPSALRNLQLFYDYLSQFSDDAFILRMNPREARDRVRKARAAIGQTDD
jgi:hypothetical protein